MESLPADQVAYYKTHEDENLQRSLLYSIILSLVMNYVGVGARIACRRYIKAKLLADDYLIICSLFPLTAMQATIGFQLTKGLGKHVMFSEDFVGYVKAIAPVETFYALTLLCIKMSMLYFYRRIFPSKTLAYFSYAVASVVIVSTFAMVIAISVLCAPFTKPWDDLGKEGLCVYRGPSFTVFASLNVATNFAILILPISYILQLHMTVVRKVHMVGVFSLGSIICVATLIRLFIPMQPSTPYASDTTWLGAQGTLWSQIEVSAAIFSACAACYRPMCMMGKSVFSKVRTSVLSRSSKRDSFSDASSWRSGRNSATEIIARPAKIRSGVKSSEYRPKDAWDNRMDDVMEGSTMGCEEKEVVHEGIEVYKGGGIRVERGISVEWERVAKEENI